MDGCGTADFSSGRFDVFFEKIFTKKNSSPARIRTQASWVTVHYTCLRTTQDFLYCTKKIWVFEQILYIFFARAKNQHLKTPIRRDLKENFFVPYNADRSAVPLPVLLTYNIADFSKCIDLVLISIDETGSVRFQNWFYTSDFERYRSVRLKRRLT